MSVTWGGRLVKGCPLTISTEDASAPHNSPASKVFCSGEGLRQGTLGKDICSFIDTRKAGPGELSLHCVGPKGKTAYCELNDHQDGTFTLNLKPQEPGRHQLSVKYGGQHVKGSPFSVRVSGAPDPDRVKVYGPGVEHGVLAMYQSRFICDTRGAGAGQLTVFFLKLFNSFSEEIAVPFHFLRSASVDRRAPSAWRCSASLRRTGPSCASTSRRSLGTTA